MATHLPAGLSPDSVDVVTELSSIITRLRAAQQQQQQQQSQQQQSTTTSSAAGSKHATGVTGTTPLATSAATPSASHPTQQHHPPIHGHAHPLSLSLSQPPGHHSHTPNAEGSTPHPNANADADAQLLSVKELPSATDGLKHKLQRARAAVRTLGDVRRAVAQQEAEMRGLEGRRAAQARALARAQADGLVFVRGQGLGAGDGGDKEGGEGMVE